MNRLRNALFAASLSGVLFVGCDGADQPNAAAKPEQVNADFGKNAGDMMKAANAGTLEKSAISKSKAASADAAKGAGTKAAEPAK